MLKCERQEQNPYLALIYKHWSLEGRKKQYDTWGIIIVCKGRGTEYPTVGRTCFYTS